MQSERGFIESLKLVNCLLPIAFRKNNKFVTDLNRPLVIALALLLAIGLAIQEALDQVAFDIHQATDFIQATLQLCYKGAEAILAR